MTVDRPHVLYRMYDGRRRLLYVGLTLNVNQRFAGHRGDKPWWTTVATIRLEHYPSRAEVEAAERAAIIAERPRFNVAHKGRTPVMVASTGPVEPYEKPRRGRPPTGKAKSKRNVRIGEIWDRCEELALAEGITMAQFVDQALVAEERRRLRRRKRAGE